MKKLWIAIVGALVLAAGGYAYYAYVYLPGQTTAEATTTTLQTSTVRVGDIVITAQGGGTLIPAQQLDLGFRTSGVLTELRVAMGDKVEAGQVLAVLDSTQAQIQLAQAQLNLASAEENLASLTSASALAAAELDMVNQQAALADAQKTLTNLLTPDVAYYQTALAEAQQGYDAAVANQQIAVSVGSRSQEQAVQNAQTAADSAYQKWIDYQSWYGVDHDKTKTAQAASDLAQQDLLAAQLQLEITTANQQSSVSAAQETLTEAQANYSYASHYTAPSADVALAQANVKVTQANLAAAQAAYAELTGEAPTGASSALSAARAQVEQAKLSVQTAQLTLDNSRLLAPFAGTITALDALVGQSVGTSAILTLADLDHAQIQLYVDETDMGYVDVGYPVSVVFDAAPDVTYGGVVLRVSPALATLASAPVVEAWASLDLTTNDAVRLLMGMNATVEVTAGEARNALLVPVQALRELAPNSYAVFVVQADGTLTLTPVTVGLKDFTNAEILAGVQRGDVVSTGVVETAP